MVFRKRFFLLMMVISVLILSFAVFSTVLFERHVSVVKEKTLKVFYSFVLSTVQQKTNQLVLDLSHDLNGMTAAMQKKQSGKNSILKEMINRQNSPKLFFALIRKRL